MDEKINAQVRQWINFASSDLDAARVLLKEEIYNESCFHSQQAVEKIFKAILLKTTGSIPKIHSLESLRLELEKIEPEWKQFRQETRFLDQFYTSVRYPDALPGNLPAGFPGKDDAEKALQSSTKISKFSREFLI